jgi:hypothetical protein
MWCQQLDELVVGKATGLGQAAPAAANIDKGVSAVDEREEIVQCNNGVGNQPDGDLHVFVAGHGRAQIKLLEVGHHELCVFGGEHTATLRSGHTMKQ